MVVRNKQAGLDKVVSLPPPTPTPPPRTKHTTNTTRNKLTEKKGKSFLYLCVYNGFQRIIILSTLKNAKQSVVLIK